MPVATTTDFSVALPPFVTKDEALLMMVVKLYETGHLSLGQAATAAGYSLRSFVDVLGHHGVTVINYPAADLAAETAW